MYSFTSTECNEQSLYYDSMKFSFPFDFISSKEVLLSIVVYLHKVQIKKNILCDLFPTDFFMRF